MCVVSFVGIDYKDRFSERWPQYYLNSYSTNNNPWLEGVSKEDFDALRKEVEGLKDLLRSAKIYDDLTGQPDCEMGEKVEFIKKLADFVGIDLEDVFMNEGDK